MKKIEIGLSDLQSEILDKIVKSVKEQKENSEKEVTRELILAQVCKQFIGNEGGKLIAQD